MQGFPKTLNTREDYEFIQANFDKKLWIPEFKALLDSNSGWHCVKELSAEELGVVDKTHKVETQRVSSEGSEEKVVRYQFEFRELENSKLKQLGFTVKEIEALIK